MVMTSLLSHQGHGRINCLASPFWINWSMANAGISRGHHLNYTAYLQYLSIFRGTHGSFNFFPSSFQCYPWIPSTIQYQILYQILLLVLLQRYIFRGTLGSPPPISILSGTPGSIRTSSVFTINPHFDNRTVFDTYNPSNLPLFLPSILILITGQSLITVPLLSTLFQRYPWILQPFPAFTSSFLFQKTEQFCENFPDHFCLFNTSTSPHQYYMLHR